MLDLLLGDDPRVAECLAYLADEPCEPAVDAAEPT